jgi:hypothetical protein
MIPLAVFSSCSEGSTTIRSPKGLSFSVIVLYLLVYWFVDVILAL